MRKKPVKSTSVGSDLKRRIVKKQQGGVASYINVNEPVLQYKNDNWIELPDVFSEYNLPTKLQNEEPKPEAVKDTKEEKPKTESERKPVKQNAFINGLRPIIEQTLKRRGLDTKWTDHLVAQAALESGWGKSESGKFNLSGIKGKGSEKNTKEYINGKMVNTRDSFRDYKDYNDWADNYINLLSNKRYGKAWTLSEDQFMPYIINAGYATDPNYINKYNKVLAEVKKYEDGGRIRRFGDGKPIKVDKSLLQHTDPRLLNPSESTRINNPYIKEKALKPTQKVDPDRFEIESMVPFIGDAADINNVSSDFSSGNYGAAALGAGLLLLPNVIEKPLKAVGKYVKQGIKKRFGKDSKFLKSRLDHPDGLNYFDNPTEARIGLMRSQGAIKNEDDFFKLFNDGEEEAWNFFNHPVIEDANKHNAKVYKRLYGTDDMKYITLDRVEDLNRDVEKGMYRTSRDEGARYHPDTHQIQLNLSAKQNNEQSLRSITHEYRHHGKYGEASTLTPNADQVNEFLDMKNKRLWKKDLPEELGEGYLYKSQEGYNNAIDAGRELGLQLGQKYPGRNALLEMMQNYKGNIESIMNAFDVSTKPRAKRVWDAMTGRYVIVLAVAGTSMLNNKE